MRTSCLKTGAKQRSKTRETTREGGEKRRERSLRGEKSFAAGRGSELEEAHKDTEGGKRTEKPSLTGERSEGVRAQSGKEEENEEEEREPDRRSSLWGLTDTRAERRRRRSVRAS